MCVPVRKRKIEGDFKAAQDGMVELECAEKDLEVTVGNKR